jgi:hypothetical protein
VCRFFTLILKNFLCNHFTLSRILFKVFLAYYAWLSLYLYFEVNKISSWKGISLSTLCRRFNFLEPKLLKMILKSRVLTEKDTAFYNYKGQLLMLFTEMIALYSENHTKYVKVKCRVTDC